MMAEDLTEILNTLNRRLAVLIHLMAYEMVQGKTLAEAAPVLRRLGLTPGEIATVFDSTAQVVSVRVSEAKRKGGKKKAKAG
ncbi:MAG: hypothetical protein E6G98_13245 [Bacillati bacterium ANGP1]|uniref:RNA polymerase sigma factor 70 region 4 type 2 domain-containing protein n=1 Tax=Candidatus Segetimicrobium genomatis TaxID=2569760 RepID=A0A537LIE6_9BACT|nr:MAG: hypothetical protein E6G98_13245 [Terrabacteria group bacterium ANGP1]